MPSFRQKPRIVFASVNVADPRGALRLFRPAAIGLFADKAGYDGVELLPVFDYLASPRMVARAVRQGKLTLNSLHASFRTTARSRETNQLDRLKTKPSLIDRVITSPLGRVIMPEVVNSSRFMASVKRRVGADLPTVMYPQKDPELDKLAIAKAGPGRKLIQATDHVAALWGVNTPEEFVDELKARGYDGVILDTAHMHPDRYNGKLPRVVSNLDRSLPVLQPHVFGVHASFGRTDVAPDPESQLHKDTKRDLGLAGAGRYVGATAQIFQSAWQAPNLEYVAVEVPMMSLGSWDYEEAVRQYARLAAGLRSYDPGAMNP